jgi:hypothetical protein
MMRAFKIDKRQPAVQDRTSRRKSIPKRLYRFIRRDATLEARAEESILRDIQYFSRDRPECREIINLAIFYSKAPQSNQPLLRILSEIQEGYIQEARAERTSETEDHLFFLLSSNIRSEKKGCKIA